MSADQSTTIWVSAPDARDVDMSGLERVFIQYNTDDVTLQRITTLETSPNVVLGHKSCDIAGK